MQITQVITGAILVLIGIYILVSIREEKAKSKIDVWKSYQWTKSKGAAILSILLGTAIIFGKADLDFFAWIGRYF